MRCLRRVIYLAVAASCVATSACSDSARTDRDARELPVFGDGTAVIRMTDDMRFAPEAPLVSVGDTVIWINDGDIPHMTSDDPGRAAVPENNVLPAGASPWHSGLLEHGEWFARVMHVSGSYAYLCPLHEALGMVAYLTVAEAVAEEGGG